MRLRRRRENPEVVKGLRDLHIQLLTECRGEMGLRAGADACEAVTRCIGDYMLYATAGRDKHLLDQGWVDKAEEACRDAIRFSRRLHSV